MSEHVAAKKVYYVVTILLMLLLALKVGVSYIDIGIWGMIATLTVATAKALLVVLYFMHVRWSSQLTWAVASAGALWLLVMFALVMMDYVTRDM